MPLFRASGDLGGGARGRRPGRRQLRGKAGEDDSVSSLTQLCLRSLADHTEDVWVRDYADNYMDRYSFRYIMGPFSSLPGELVEELTRLLAAGRRLSRAALHLLLVPQLRVLSLETCPGLVTSDLCAHIAARCQGLWSLDLSGAQRLPSKVLSETLCSLPDLRSLSLAGTTCDGGIVETVARRCRSLRHLDVSRCHFLSPAALLLLAAGASLSSSGHPSGTPRSSIPPSSSTLLPPPLPPPPLSSLLALDIGFGEEEGDPSAVAAHLLLSLPCLERVAMDGAARACRLLREGGPFDRADELTDRAGVPRLGEVWRERRNRQSTDGRRTSGEGAAAREEVEGEEGMLWGEHGGESEEDASGDEGGSSCSPKRAEEKRRRRAPSLSGDERLVLRLKDVKGVSCDSLDSLSCLCPDVHSISVDVDEEDAGGRNQGFLLASGLRVWSGQLRSLSVRYPCPLVDLLPAIEVAGPSLLSLALEGVETCPQSPLQEVIGFCPRLRELLIAAEPPTTGEEDEEDEGDRRDDRDLPQLPDLCCLTLRFSYEHSQMKPVMSWISLRKVLKCLLTGSPSLERISLVSPPCPVNAVLQDVLRFGHPADIPPMPLGRVRHIELPRTDVKVGSVKSIMQRSQRLKYVDVRGCWQIRQTQWLDCKASSKVQVVWS